MDKQNNVFLNINLIHTLLSLTRPAGFSISKSNKPERYLSNQFKYIFFVALYLFSLYEVSFEGYHSADFGNITTVLNALIVISLLFILISEPIKFIFRFKVWKIIRDLHECDLMVDLFSFNVFYSKLAFTLFAA